MMDLLPLEFSDCLLDSPYFRENLKAHERQLDQTASSIKGIVKDIHDVIEAAKSLSKAKRGLANSLANCQFACIGNSLTQDEVIIANSLREFAAVFSLCEDEMDRMLEHALEKFVTPLETFRKEKIGSVKKRRKDFDKHTSKFCSAQDRYASLSSKKEDSLAEAAETVRHERKCLNGASLEYVYSIQVVQERKKFDFVEAIVSFMQAWSTYYKHGHSVTSDFSHYMMDLKSRVQRTRENFSATIGQYENLKEKMRTASHDPGLLNRMYTRQGYLYAQNKKTNIKIGSQWTKYFCQYQTQSKRLTMIPYSQLSGKITTTETIRVHECLCKDETCSEKFRFTVTGDDLNEQQGPGQVITHTFQAMSDYERKQWVEAMGGTWPNVNSLQRIKADSVEDNLNSMAFIFLKDCLHELEARGLSDQGLYRVGGVVSKVKNLLSQGLEPTTNAGESRPLDLSDPKMWESKTIASAIKQYFRDLSKPLMTHQLYQPFVDAVVKHESEEERLDELHGVMQKLPMANREILKVLIRHLNKVASNADKNLMTASNLGVCFGPTLLRPFEETVASIMDIKFCNEVVELLIENCDRFFHPSSSSSNSSSQDMSGASSHLHESSRTEIGHSSHRKTSLKANSASSSTPMTINLRATQSPSSSPMAVPPSILRLEGDDQVDSPYPKRTKSFSSLSHWSIKSLPEIRENRGKSMTPTLPQKSFTNDRPRSKSTQHPESFMSPTGVDLAHQRSLPPSTSLQKGSKQDDLMASLEMMNTLAADLPGMTASVSPNYSPLRRSKTIQGTSSTATHQLSSFQKEVHKKPPLPKLSLSSLSSSCSSPHSTYEEFAPSLVEVRRNQRHISPSPSNCSSSDSAASPRVNRLPLIMPHHRHSASQEQPRAGGNNNGGNATTRVPSRGTMPSNSVTKEEGEGRKVPGRDELVKPVLISGGNTPPTIPTRKYRNILVSKSTYQEHLAKIEGKLPNGPLRVEQSIGPAISSPSPTGDSGIAGSPPVKVRESDRLSNHEESDMDALSVTSSALSVESDTTTSRGSKYENSAFRNSHPCEAEHEADGDDEAEDECDGHLRAPLEGSIGKKSLTSEASSIDLDSSDENEEANLRDRRTRGEARPDLIVRAHVREANPKLRATRKLSARYRDSGPYDNVFDDEWTSDKGDLSQMLAQGQTSNV